MKINSETWKNFGFSGIGWVLIFQFGLGLGSKKVGFLLRGFGYPSLLVSLTKTTFSVKTFGMENNYNILMLLSMWEKSIDLARIFLHAPLGRKIVIKKYLFSLMKILVWSFFKFHFPSSLHFLSILFLESNSTSSIQTFFANDSWNKVLTLDGKISFFLKNPQRMF